MKHRAVTHAGARSIRKAALPLLAISAASVVVAGFAGAGSSGVWGSWNAWLRAGGFETVASVAAIAMAFSGLGTSFVAKHVGPMSNAEFHKASSLRWRAIPYLPAGVHAGSPTPGEYLAENGLDAGSADVAGVAGLLTSQLGPRLADAGNVLSWPLHLRCLVACLVDPEDGTWESMSWLRHDASWADPEKDMSRLANSILGRRWPEVTARLAMHSHLRPAILRLCDEANARGALPASRLLWLRQVDRTLWRAAGDIGRPSCHAEALGALSHYRTERRAGGPLPEPDMRAAAMALLAVAGAPPAERSGPG